MWDIVCKKSRIKENDKRAVEGKSLGNHKASDVVAHLENVSVDN